jgi:hypothetical protein
MQFPITYYFHEDDEGTSLAGILPYLADIADQCARRKGAATLAAVALGGAVDDYLRLIARTFLSRQSGSREDLLRAYAENHLRTMARSPVHLLRAA